MAQIEFPELRSSSLPALLIGRNSRNRWIVKDPLGLRGGLFANRPDAFRFAAKSSRAIMIVPYVIEFEWPKAGPLSPGSDEAPAPMRAISYA